MSKDGSYIAFFEAQQDMVYQSTINGMLYYRNPIGHIRKISVPQWNELLRKGMLCNCHACVACGVLNITLKLIEETDNDERKESKGTS